MDPIPEISPGVAPITVDLAGTGEGNSKQEGGNPAAGSNGKAGRNGKSTIRRARKSKAQGEPLDDAKGIAGNPAMESAEPVRKMPRETVERAIKSLVGIIDTTVKSAVRGEAFRINPDETFADEYRDKVAVSEDERNEFSKLGADVCEQYGLLGNHAALMFLAVFVLGYVGRVTLTMVNLRKLHADKLKIFGNAPKEPPKPVPGTGGDDADLTHFRQ